MSRRPATNLCGPTVSLAMERGFVQAAESPQRFGSHLPQKCESGGQFPITQLPLTIRASRYNDERISESHPVSNMKFVRYCDRGFWAYDVALGTFSETPHRCSRGERSGGTSMVIHHYLGLARSGLHTGYRAHP